MIRSRKLVVTFSLEEELCNYLKREFVDATILLNSLCMKVNYMIINFIIS